MLQHRRNLNLNHNRNSSSNGNHNGSRSRNPNLNLNLIRLRRSGRKRAVLSRTKRLRLQPGITGRTKLIDKYRTLPRLWPQRTVSSVHRQTMWWRYRTRQPHSPLDHHPSKLSPHRVRHHFLS